jgi:hypothetical protein
MYAMKGHKINLSDNILVLRLLKSGILAISDQSGLVSAKVENIYHLTYSPEFDVMNNTATLFTIRALVDREATGRTSAKKESE